MLSHFEPGVKIYKFVALRKICPYINLRDLGEVGHTMGSGHSKGFGADLDQIVVGVIWLDCQQAKMPRVQATWLYWFYFL